MDKDLTTASLHLADLREEFDLRLKEIIRDARDQSELKKLRLQAESFRAVDLMEDPEKFADEWQLLIDRAEKFAGKT